MLELLRLALNPLVAAVRSRRDLALENLVLRHQLQVALRTNPHPHLRARIESSGSGFATSGLKAGDGVVVEGQYRLQNGSKVKPRPAGKSAEGEADSG